MHTLTYYLDILVISLASADAHDLLAICSLEDTGCSVSSSDDQNTTSIQSGYFTAVAEWCTKMDIPESFCSSLTKVSTHLNFRMGNLSKASTYSNFGMGTSTYSKIYMGTSTYSYFHICTSIYSNFYMGTSTYSNYCMGNLTKRSTHLKFHMSNLSKVSTCLNFCMSDLGKFFFCSKFPMNNLTKLFIHSNFCVCNLSKYLPVQMNNLAIWLQPAELTDYVPLSYSCYNPHLTLLMLPFCTEKADFVQYIYQIYDFVTEHISKLFWWIYQSIPCAITNFADKYSEVLNWISCLDIITEIPCWTISELIVGTHQNIMRQQDFAALKKNFVIIL